MPADVVIGGKTLRLVRRSDVAVALRVAGHFQRRIAEDDWRPYQSRMDAVRAWTRLGGIRLQVMEALSLLNESWTSAAPTAQGLADTQGRSAESRGLLVSDLTKQPGAQAGNAPVP